MNGDFCNSLHNDPILKARPPDRFLTGISINFSELNFPRFSRPIGLSSRIVREQICIASNCRYRQAIQCLDNNIFLVISGKMITGTELLVPFSFSKVSTRQPTRESGYCLPNSSIAGLLIVQTTGDRALHLFSLHQVPLFYFHHPVVDSFLQGGISFPDDRKENLPCNEKIKLQKLHSDKNIIKYYTSTFFNDAICIMILRRNVTVRKLSSLARSPANQARHTASRA